MWAWIKISSTRQITGIAPNKLLLKLLHDCHSRKSIIDILSKAQPSTIWRPTHNIYALYKVPFVLKYFFFFIELSLCKMPLGCICWTKGESKSSPVKPIGLDSYRCKTSDISGINRKLRTRRLSRKISYCLL